MTALAGIQSAPGLELYLERVEERLTEAVSSHPGLAAEIGADALEAGGKRLRPLLVFLTTPEDGETSLEAGVAVELVHLASLVHDDVIDGAEVRRGRESAWSAHGPGAAAAAGDYLFARAFAELAAAGDARGVALLAETCLSLVRGEALEWSQRHRPETRLEEYFERCMLKTARLLEAACILGSRSDRLAEFGLALGIAFQIVDDCLDCVGRTLETGKIPGTDLREGIPTLPLLLAASEDDVVRRALAGGPLEGALLRVGATGAIERALEVACEYAERARASLDGLEAREELEAIADAVVDRTA